MMKTYTIQDINHLPHCYRNIYGILKRYPHLSMESEGTLIEILNDEKITLSDRLWAVCHLMPEKVQRLFACDCAEKVLPIFENKYPTDRRPRNAITAAREYAGDRSTKNKNGLTMASFAAGACFLTVRNNILSPSAVWAAAAAKVIGCDDMAWFGLWCGAAAWIGASPMSAGRNDWEKTFDDNEFVDWAIKRLMFYVDSKGQSQ
jgi:hypothetical protein